MERSGAKRASPVGLGTTTGDKVRMQAFIAPPTPAPRSSDRQPDASQFSFPLSAPLPAGVLIAPLFPGPLAPHHLPPPRAFHVEGSPRDCLPGALSGFAGWRSLFPSSYLPMWLPLRSECVLQRLTAPALATPMPALCSVGVQPEAPVAGHANHGIQMPHPCREVRILRPLPTSPDHVRG